MTGVRVALRIARRDAWRHRGRSLLVMTLIALPVLAGVAIDVLARSGEATPAQQAQAEFAGADAWLVAPDGVGDVVQSWSLSGQPRIFVDAPVGTGDDVRWIAVDDRPARPAADVLPLLPEGSQITPWQRADFVPVTADGIRYASVTADLLDIASPAAGGRYTVLAGQAPAAPSQIAVTTHLARQLGVAIGDRVHVGAPARSYVISAVVGTAATGNAQIPGSQFNAVVALPGQLNVITVPWGIGAGPSYLVVSPEPITLPMIDQLNAHGIGVFSKDVLTDPAARAQIDPPRSSPMLVAGAVIGIVMAIMQVVFLAGPAFAIGARRMRRQLGQLVATGARPRHLFSVVLGSGLVLGIAGSLVGLAAGIGVGAALRVAFRAWLGYRSAALQIPFAEVVGIAALGVVTAVLAALIPAISASRTSPLTLLGRQPAPARHIRWWSLTGAALAVVGVVGTVWMAARTLPGGATGPVVMNRALGLASGAVLVEVGLLLAVPLVVHLVSKLGRSLPTAGRLALRDIGRNRGRTAPAVAAVTVCATAAVMLSVLIASAGKNAESRYVAGVPTGDVQVEFGFPDVWAQNPADGAIGHQDVAVTAGARDLVAAAEAATAAQWPTSHAVAYSVVDDQTASDGGRALYIPDENLCPYGETAGHQTSWSLPDGAFSSPGYSPAPPTAAQAAGAATDWRCFGRSYSTLTAEEAGAHRSDGAGVISATRMPTVVVGGPELRRAVTGIADPAADAALEAGGAVAMDRTLLAQDGTVKSALMVTDPTTVTTTQTADGMGVGSLAPNQPTDIKSVSAVLGAWTPAPLGVVLSPQAAERLGWAPTPGGLIVDPGEAVTPDQTQQVALAVQAASGSYAQATVEPGRLIDPGDGTRQPLTVLLLVIALLAAGTVIVVTALGLADARPDLATLAAVGAPPRIRRLTTGWSAAVVTVLGSAIGGAVGMVPAWGLLRLMQTIQRDHADPIVVPWAALAASLVAVPLIAYAIGALLPRSRLPMIARVE